MDRVDFVSIVTAPCSLSWNPIQSIVMLTFIWSVTVFTVSIILAWRHWTGLVYLFTTAVSWWYCHQRYGLHGLGSKPAIFITRSEMIKGRSSRNSSAVTRMIVNDMPNQWRAVQLFRYHNNWEKQFSWRKIKLTTSSAVPFSERVEDIHPCFMWSYRRLQ